MNICDKAKKTTRAARQPHIWRIPKMEVPENHPFLFGSVHYKPSNLWYLDVSGVHLQGCSRKGLPEQRGSKELWSGRTVPCTRGYQGLPGVTKSHDVGPDFGVLTFGAVLETASDHMIVKIRCLLLDHHHITMILGEHLYLQNLDGFMLERMASQSSVRSN